MLSRIGKEQQHHRLPTIEDPTPVLPTEWRRIVSGLRRKAFIVHPKCAIGWTGSAVFSSPIITDLRACLREKDALQKQDLINAFAYIDAEYPKHDLTLLGWVIFEKTGYLVEYEWNNFRTHAPPHYVCRGSGSEEFGKVIRGSEHLNNSNREIETTERFPAAVADAVSLVAILIGDEFSTGSNLPLLYGGGYDILVYVKGSFRYVPNIWYCFFRVKDIERDTSELSFASTLFQFCYIDTNLVIIRRVFKQDDQSSRTVQENTISVLGDMGKTNKDLEELDYSELGEQTKNSLVAAVFVGNVESEQKNFVASFVGGCKSKYFRLSGEGLHVHEDVLKDVLSTLRKAFTEQKSSTSNNNHSKQPRQ